MAKIQVKKDVVMLQATNASEVLNCMSIAGATKIFDGVYEFPHSSMMAILRKFYNIQNLVELKRAVDDGKMHEVIYKIAKKYDENFDATEQLKAAGPHEIDDDSFLFRHQQLGRQIALINPKYCFFYETGTGKTPMALQIISDDVLMNPTHRWLVICPLALINTAWVGDCNKFFPYLKIVSLHGNTPAQTRKAYQTPAHIYVINFESFKTNYDTLVNAGFEGVFVDESSKLKNPTSGISKAALKFSKTVKRWYNLSGTPAPNSMLEYYTQMKLVDEKLFPNNYTSYKAKWFYSYSKGGFDAYDILPEKKDELIQVIKQRAVFVSKKDCLDLPPVVDQAYEIPMPSDLKTIYNTMKNDLYASVNTDIGLKHILAASNVTSLGKLNQLTSGIIMDEDGAVHRVSDAKINVLKEVLETIGDKQAIIWAYYHGEFEMIKDLLGDDCVLYYGETDKKDILRLCDKHYGAGAFDKLKNGEYPGVGASLSIKDIAVKLFKEGKVKYFVGNPASAAYGLTLTNAHYTIYFGLDYSYERYAQSRDRTNRYGQTESCTYIHLLMKGTIDYVLYKVLHDKQDLLTSVLDHLKPESIGGKNE